MADVRNALKNSFRKGREILNREQESVTAATFEMMILVFATKMLGLFKMSLLAGTFGASRELDIFYIANTIPELIFNIIAVGSVNAALVPVFSKCLSKNGKGSAAGLFSKVLNITLAAFVVLAVIMFIFAPSMVRLSLNVNVGGVAANFSEYEIKVAATMMRIMLISPILLGVSSVIAAYLLVRRRYIATRIAPLLYNIGTIVGILVLVPLTGNSILGVAFGIVLASVFHLASQLPTLLHLIEGGRESDPEEEKKQLKSIGKLALPRVVTVASNQIGVVARNVIALNLVPGSLSAYQFARNIFSMGVDLFGTTTAEAVFPKLSAMVAEGDREGAKQLFQQGLQQLLLFTIPIAVLVLVLRVPLVRLLYGLVGSGFTWEDTIMTSWVLLFMGGIILVQAVITLALRGFYSLEDTVTPFIVSMIALVLNIVASVLFVNLFSNFNTYSLDQPYAQLGVKTIIEYLTVPGGSPVAVGGLAFSGLVVWTIEAVVLMCLLNKKLRFCDSGTFKKVGKKSMSGVFMAASIYAAFKLLDHFLDTRIVVQLFIVILSSTIVGISVFLAAEYLLGDDDLEKFRALILKIKDRLKILRLIKRKPNPVEPITF